MSQFVDVAPYKWRTVRVFISSTFRDFHAERDYLIKFVFPELRQWCEQFKLHLLDIDLRWGVTQEEAENGKVLDICLKQIDGCRPFFICMLGNRYGWVSKPGNISDDTKKEFSKLKGKEDHSITHLEIEHAVLEPLTSMDIFENIPHAFFYFRDERCLPQTQIIASLTKDEFKEYQATFFEPDSKNAEKLYKLKEKIVNHYKGNGRKNNNPSEIEKRIYEYHPVFDVTASNPEDDKLKGRLTRKSLEDFGRRVHNDLKISFEEQFKERIAYLYEKKDEDKLLTELDLHEAFVENHIQHFIGRNELLTRLREYAESDTDQILAVFGGPGSGKSSILAKFYNEYKYDENGNERNNNILIIPHFIGSSANSGSLYSLLRRFCEEIFEYSLKSQMEKRLDEIVGDDEEFVEDNSRSHEENFIRESLALGKTKRRNKIKKEYEIPSDIDKLSELFKDFLEKVERNVLILIDGLNQMDEANSHNELYWLPSRLPKYIKIIASSLEGKTKEFLEGKTNNILFITPLTKSERFEIIQTIPSVFAKTLEQRHISYLLENAATENPLYLKVALEELRVFGSFEKLEERIKKLPENILILFRQVLARLENDPGTPKGLVEKLFSLLGSSRYGLSENELDNLLEFDKDKVHKGILRQIRNYIQYRGELLDFYHGQFRTAAESLYLDSEQKRISANQSLAIYLLYKTDPDKNSTWKGNSTHGFSELPYHQIQGCMWTDLRKTLCNLHFIEAKSAAGMALGLLEDFQLAKYHVADTVILSVLDEFQTFLRSYIHVVDKHPELVHQMASNFVENSIPRNTAEANLATKREQRPFLQLLYGPNIHALMTIDFNSFFLHKYPKSIIIEKNRMVALFGDQKQQIATWDIATGTFMSVIELSHLSRQFSMVSHSKETGGLLLLSTADVSVVTPDDCPAYDSGKENSPAIWYSFDKSTSTIQTFLAKAPMEEARLTGLFDAPQVRALSRPIRISFLSTVGSVIVWNKEEALVLDQKYWTVLYKVRRPNPRGAWGINCQLLPNHKILLMADDSELVVISTDTWEEISRFRAHTDSVITCIGISNDEKLVVTGGPIIRVWSTATLIGENTQSLKTKDPIESLAFSPDNKLLAFYSEAAGKPELMVGRISENESSNLSQFTEVRLIQGHEYTSYQHPTLSHVNISVDISMHRRGITFHDDKLLRLSFFRKIQYLGGPKGCYVLSPDGQFLAEVKRVFSKIFEIEYKPSLNPYGTSGSVIQRRQLQEFRGRVFDISSDCRLVCIDLEDNTVQINLLKEWQPLFRWVVWGRITYAAFSHCSKFLAVGTFGGEAYLFKLIGYAPGNLHIDVVEEKASCPHCGAMIESIESKPGGVFKCYQCNNILSQAVVREDQKLQEGLWHDNKLYENPSYTHSAIHR